MFPSHEGNCIGRKNYFTLSWLRPGNPRPYHILLYFPKSWGCMQITRREWFLTHDDFWSLSENWETWLAQVMAELWTVLTVWQWRQLSCCWEMCSEIMWFTSIDIAADFSGQSSSAPTSHWRESKTLQGSLMLFQCCTTAMLVLLAAMRTKLRWLFPPGV